VSATVAVSADDLWRGYGRQRVLCGVSLALPPGRCLAVLGPNGAGKSTLLWLLAAALRPVRGCVRIHGADPFADPSARRKIGFVGHDPMLYAGLTVVENLHLLAALYGLRDGSERAAELCALLGIDHPTILVRRLSRGGRQRAALARALLHRPSVLLLDEPFSGLDQRGVDTLEDILRRFCRNGGTAVLTSHSTTEVVRVAEEAAVLAVGRLSVPSTVDGMNADSLRAWYAAAADGMSR
jgi:heme exporter protein A